MWTDYYEMTEAQRMAHDENFGGFNDVPPNWREVTEGEMTDHRIFEQVPRAVQFRQMRVGEGRPLLSTQLYFFDDGSGYGRAVDYAARHIRWFVFARCLHVEEVIETGRSHTVYRCKKCGCKRCVDSSD